MAIYWTPAELVKMHDWIGRNCPADCLDVSRVYMAQRACLPQDRHRVFFPVTGAGAMSRIRDAGKLRAAVKHDEWLASKYPEYLIE